MKIFLSSSTSTVWSNFQTLSPFMAFSVVIPWLCLNPKTQKPISDSAIPKASTILKKFFVEAVNNVCDFPISQLPQLIVKGDMISITIPNEEYLVGLASCKHNLHGRIIWPKGSVPLKVEVLKKNCRPFGFLWVSGVPPLLGKAFSNSHSLVLKIFKDYVPLALGT